MASSTLAERRAAYRAVRGYIGSGGLVICGACFDDHRFAAAWDALERSRFESEAWQRFNPEPGDDFCSECDASISRHWRETE